MSSASAVALDAISGIFDVSELHFLVNLAKSNPSLIFSRVDLHKRVFKWCELPSDVVSRRLVILDALLLHSTVMDVPMHIAERLFYLAASSPTECIALLERQFKVADWFAEKRYGSSG